MKNLMYVAALALATQCYAETNSEKIEEAIEQSSLPRVKSLMREADSNEMTVQARKKMYKNFYDMAVETTENLTQNLSITGNWRDMTKVGLGAASLLLGGLLALRSRHRDNAHRVHYNRPSLLGSAGFLGFGAYLLYQGVKCSSQKASIAVAKSIEKFMKKKLTNLDVASDL